nr:transposase family protein [uncultured Bacteroides sp.]
MLPYFEAAHDDYLSEYELNGKRRSHRRSFCIYKNSPLPDVPERLFFILVYLKNNPLQEYHAACFGMGQKHCNTFVHCLNHVLRLGLETMGLVPAQTDKELSDRLSELSKDGTVEPVLLHDGTERETGKIACKTMCKTVQKQQKTHFCKTLIMNELQRVL